MYNIPGRATDGNYPSHHRLRRITRNSAVIAARLIAVPVLFVLDSGSGGGMENLPSLLGGSPAGLIMVSGTTNDCSALSFADAIRAARNNLWITHSASRTAIVQADLNNSTKFIWEGDAELTPEFANRDPKNDPGVVTWTWKDESTASLKFSHGESIRMRKHEGLA